MSIAEDLSRNRIAYEELFRSASAPSVEAVSPPTQWNSGRVVTPPEEIQAPARMSSPVTEPARAEEPEPRRVVYSLGLPPGLKRRESVIETGVVYPDVGEERAVSKDDAGTFSDDAYKSLLRRVDAEARRESQLTGEEGLF